MIETAPQASTFASERTLLLRCAACAGNAEDRAQLSEVAARPLDWNRVLTTAESHGVLPLLRVRLEEICPGAVPAAIRNQLLAGCVANAAQNLRMTGELLGLLQAMEESGIEAVPFKGPVLANHLFGNIAMRQFRDLDILVRPGDVERARAVMLGRGYLPEFELTGARQTEYLRSEHSLQFTREEGGFIVELHWSFGSRDQAFPLSAAAVWSRLRQAKLQGRRIPTLSSEDLLIYLALHGAKHGWNRLEWICSLAQLIRVETELDWEIAFSRAQRTGAMRGLCLGLLLASDICSVPLPGPVLKRAAGDAGARELAADVRAGLLADGAVTESSEFRRQAFYLRTRERLSDRARIVLFYWVRIPHPHSKDWEMFRLPASLSFLYYFLRPLRLLGECGIRLFQAETAGAAVPGPSGGPVSVNSSGGRPHCENG